VRNPSRCVVRPFSYSTLYTVSMIQICSHRQPLTRSRALTNQHTPSGLRVYITGDGSDVYEDLLMKVAKSGSEKFQPVLVLVGIRLGIERITPVYWKGLQDILRMSQSVGIAG